MKLRFRAHVNFARATAAFRPEAVNSTSIGGFFVHRDFENVEQYQQVRPVEGPSRRIAPPRPTQKRPKERGKSDREEMAGEGGSGVGGKSKGKVESKMTGKEEERRKKKGEGKKNEMGKGKKGSEVALGGEEMKNEVKNKENGIMKMGKKEGKMKAKKYDMGKAMKKEVNGKKGKVSGEGDKAVDMRLELMGASGGEFSGVGNPMFATMSNKVGKERGKSAAPSPPANSSKREDEFSEAGNSFFATMGDKKEKERSKDAAVKQPVKPPKKGKEFSEAGNPLFATMGDKMGKERKGEAAKPLAKSAKKDKGGFSEAGNPIFATMGQKVGKENIKGSEAKMPAKPAKKEEGRRMFMKKKDEAPKVEVVAPKPRKLPPVDTNAPSARNPLLKYKERPDSGELQVRTSPQGSSDTDSGDEFDA